MGERTQALVEVLQGDSLKQLVGVSLHYQWGFGRLMLMDVLNIQRQLRRMDFRAELNNDFSKNKLSVLLGTKILRFSTQGEENFSCAAQRRSYLENLEQVMLQSDNNNGYAHLIIILNQQGLYQKSVLALYNHRQELVSLRRWIKQGGGAYFGNKIWRNGYRSLCKAQGVQLISPHEGASSELPAAKIHNTQVIIELTLDESNTLRYLCCCKYEDGADLLQNLLNLSISVDGLIIFDSHGNRTKLFQEISRKLDSHWKVTELSSKEQYFLDENNPAGTYAKLVLEFDKIDLKNNLLILYNAKSEAVTLQDWIALTAGSNLHNERWLLGFWLMCESYGFNIYDPRESKDALILMG